MNAFIEKLSKNRYAVVSVVLLVCYFGATFIALSFLVRHIRAALTIDESAAQGQVTTFDKEGYDAIAERFGIQKQ